MGKIRCDKIKQNESSFNFLLAVLCIFVDIRCNGLKYPFAQKLHFSLFSEPNLLSNTQHSVSRKGIKRRDLNVVELRDLISNLLPLIRCEHILPASNDVLTGAVKRGLVSMPPSCMLSGSDDLSPHINPWVVSRSRRLRRRPRLYMPFVEEAKVNIRRE